MHRHPRWLFPSQAGTPLAPALQVMDRGTTQRAFKHAAEAASIRKHVSIHSLRHSCITALSNAGVAVEVRQKIVGHSTAEQNLHYTHAELSRVRTAIESLPRISKSKK